MVCVTVHVYEIRQKSPKFPHKYNTLEKWSDWVYSSMLKMCGAYQSIPLPTRDM